MRKWHVNGRLVLAGFIALAGGWNVPAQAGSNPIPYIQGISPVSVAPGSADFTLTVSGSNFESSSVIQWNGTALATTLANGDLTATVPAADVASSTTASITVMNPGPPATLSNTVYFTVTGSSASVNYSAFQTPATGQGPFQPVIADFNGDGKLDIAISDQLDSPGTVVLFLGSGSGSFQPPVSFKVGTSPEGLVAGDFNGDGIQDVAVLNTVSGTVTVLLGDSMNPFVTSMITTLPSGDTDPFQAAAADFNQDGNLDLAVTCQSSGNVVVLLGNGDGTFASNPMAFGDMAQPAGVAIADFNGDGKLDLAVADAANNEVWILNGNGDGTFSAGTPYATSTSPEGVAVGDLNQDGTPDLAVADLSAHEVSILLNSGSGTFPTHTEYASSPGAYFLLADDLNGDGLLDLAVTTDFGSNFNVLLGTGGGAFAPALSFTAASNTVGIAAADFVGTGQLDLVVTDNNDGTVSILRQSSQLTFKPASLTFANQLVGTRSSVLPLTMTNTGNVAVTFFSILGNDPTDFLQTNTCGNALAPGASCTFSVTFSPSRTGLIQSSITLRDNAPGNPQSIALSGTGAAPVASLSPTSLAFSPPSWVVGSSSTTQTVTVSNTAGTWPLTIGSIQLTGEYSETTTCPLSPATLAAGSNCAINVTFKPTSTGVQSGTLTVVDNSNAIGSSTQTASVSGTAVAAVATLSPPTLPFGSLAVGKTSPGQIAMLTNDGSTTLNISSITTSAPYGETNNCGTTLGVGLSCSITVTFTPTANGTQNGTLTVTDHSTGGTGVSQTVSLTGTGLAPVASLSPTTFSFGNQSVGSTSTPTTLSLTNTGGASLVISGVAPSGDFSVSSDACTGSLAVNASCKVSVTFNPSTEGTRNGTLTVTDNSNGVAGSTQIATLSGTGQAPEANLSPSSLTFGSQGVGTASATQNLTLTNNGSASLTINSIIVSGDFTETTTCGSSLSPAANCTITVTFKPTAAGTRSGSISVTDNSNNGTGLTQTVNLTGTGTVATASLAPAALTFASQGVGTTSAAQTVTLSNTGAAPLSITSIAGSGTNSADFAITNNCNGSVAAGASCAITVTFTPVAAGSAAATLTVTDNNNGVSGSTQTVSLSGTGNAPVVQLSAATVTFANQNVGTGSSVQNITLTNSGTAVLSLTSITANGDFSLTNGCGTTLSPGAACTVTVMFKPTTPGSRTGVLSIADNASPSSQTVSLTGTGVGPESSISPASLAFGGELIGAASGAQTVKLTNGGNASLTVTNIASSGDFSETNTCPSSLAAGASCTVTVTFKPGAAGSRTGTLTLTDSASATPQTAALTGTGQDFSLTATSTSASISPGQTETYTVTLNPLDGLKQAVSLSCTGAPSLGSCSVTPSSATPAGPTTIKVSVSTTGASMLAPKPPSAPQAVTNARSGCWWLCLRLEASAAWREPDLILTADAV